MAGPIVPAGVGPVQSANVDLVNQLSVQTVPPDWLLERAREVREHSLRLRARSVQLVARALETQQTVMRGFERIAAARAERQRMKAAVASGAKARGRVETIRPLPLTPSMLMELAQEFRLLADRAATPHGRAALHGLAFRYTALAAGFDTRAMPSRMMH